MWGRLAAVLVAMVAVLTSSAEAQACKCADTSTSVTRPGLTSDSSEMRVRYDSIEITCEDRALKRCTWRQRHHVSNGGSNAAHVEGRVADALRGVKAHVELLDDESYETVSTLAVDPHAVAFDVPAESQAVVVIEAQVSFGSGSCGCWATGLMRRHPVVSRGSDVEAELTYVTHHGLPEDAWTNVSLSIEYPGPGRIRSTHARGLKTRSIGGGRLRSTAQFRDQDIAIFLERRNVVARGGPFVAVGGGWGTQRPLRLRAGYEFGAPRWLVHSVAVESDTTDVRVVPGVLALSGHSWFPLLPAGGIGLGVPIDVYPNPRVGMRAQIDVSWYVVTFVATADYFPLQGRNQWTGALYAQFSF